MFDLADTIELLRQEKNMSIKELCLDIMSTTTYYRFINKKAMINIDLYIQLLHRLKIEIAMFLQTYTDYFGIFHHYELLRHAITKKELAYCEIILSIYDEEDKNIDHQLIYHTANCVYDVLHSQIPRKVSLEIIFDHFLHGGKLTELEFYCMLILIDIIDFEQLESIVNIVQNNLLLSPDRESSEVVYYIYAKYLEQLIYHKKIELAHRYYQEIQNQPINHFDVGKKIYHLFLNALCDITLFNNLSELKNIILSIKFSRKIQMDYQAILFENIYRLIQPVYQLPDLDGRSKT